MWNSLKKHRYVQGTAEATEKVYEAFRKRRRLLIKMSLVSAALTFASLAIVGTQLFYPFHVVIGGGLYILSFIPFIYRIYLSRDTWRKYHAYKVTTNFVKKERRRFLIAIIVLILVAVFLWLRPLDDNPFADFSDEEIVMLVEDDLYRSVTAMDYLETTGTELLMTLSEMEEDSNLTEDIVADFEQFIMAVGYSESLTEVHRYFSSIPYGAWDTRIKSFLIANSLYAKKYELIHRIILEVEGSDHKKKALNHYISAVGQDGVYTEMATRFYHPKTRVRLTGGRLYQQVFVDDSDEHGYAATMLRTKAEDSYSYLLSNFDETLLAAPEVLTDSIEAQMFTAWFPIQKETVTAIGHIILSTRGKEGLITKEHITTMEQSLEPGDIMLERRNWHVSNVGIPGFWTHVSLYTSNLNTMDAYFASEFPYQGYESLSDYMKAEVPLVYALYQNEAEPPAVIEAMEPGVITQSLEASLNADFVAVLRPNLSKQDKLLALMRAFSNAGKPYDYNFDFSTLDAIVCSELIYDSYFERLPEKAGLQFETSRLNGRPIVTPVDIAEKYVAERGTAAAQLDFVYFIASDESSDTSFVSTESAFVDSLNWSKFSFLQTDVSEK